MIARSLPSGFEFERSSFKYRGGANEDALLGRLGIPEPGATRDDAAGVVTVTTASYAATSAAIDYILVDDDTAGETVTVSLPPADERTSPITIKKLGTTADVVIDGDGAETIDGDATVTIAIQYVSLKVMSDGSNWSIVSHNIPSRVAYGCMSVEDNDVAVTLNAAAVVQITDFSVNGPSNETTPDHTNDHITVVQAGDYLVAVSATIINDAAQSHTIHIGLHTNNGANEFGNVHAHRTLTGGSSDVGSMSLSGIVTFAAEDTVELWADTDFAGDRDVIFQDVSLVITRIG